MQDWPPTGSPLIWICQWFPTMPDRIRLIVADDEALARRLIRKYSAGCSGVEMVCECTDTTMLATALVDVPADAALVDVRMPGDDLFDVLANVAQQHRLPPLVFATAYDRYAV